VKLNLSDVLPEKRAEFLRLSGKQLTDEEVAALKADTNVFNNLGLLTFLWVDPDHLSLVKAL
jgi:hypothetical protein